jgi:hypothetical protein
MIRPTNLRPFISSQRKHEKDCTATAWKMRAPSYSAWKMSTSSKYSTSPDRALICSATTGPSELVTLSLCHTDSCSHSEHLSVTGFARRRKGSFFHTCQSALDLEMSVRPKFRRPSASELSWV